MSSTKIWTLDEVSFKMILYFYLFIYLFWHIRVKCFYSESFEYVCEKQYIEKKIGLSKIKIIYEQIPLKILQDIDQNKNVKFGVCIKCY